MSRAQQQYPGRPAPQEPKFFHRWPLTSTVLLFTVLSTAWASLVLPGTFAAPALIAVGLLTVWVAARYVDWWARVPLMWRSAALDAGLQLVSSGLPHLRGFMPNPLDSSLTLQIERRKNSMEELEDAAPQLARLLHFESCEVLEEKRTYRLVFRREVDLETRGPAWGG